MRGIFCVGIMWGGFFFTIGSALLPLCHEVKGQTDDQRVQDEFGAFHQNSLSQICLITEDMLQQDVLDSKV